MPSTITREDIEKVVEMLDVPNDETFVKAIEVLRMPRKLNVFKNAKEPSR